MNDTSIVYKTPNESEFSEVCKLIDVYQLDNRNLIRKEFTIATQHQQLIAFGRFKTHNDCIELCSIGVIPAIRNKGIGTSLIKHMLTNATYKTIYVVCIIPHYFKRFGFLITNDYPDSIKNKKNYCTNELTVPEPYVVMKLDKS